MHILIKDKYLYFRKYKVKCAVGKRGIGHKRKEGDYITPIGIFKIKFILYRKDRIKKFRTSLKKISINKNFVWCYDPYSKSYNKLIKYPFEGSAEKLFRKDNIYDLIIVLNYNMNPVKKNKGSAIFIHISKRNYKKTEGCVAIRKKELLKIIINLKKKTTVKIS